MLDALKAAVHIAMTHLCLFPCFAEKECTGERLPLHAIEPGEVSNAEPSAAADDTLGGKPNKAKKQKTKGSYAPQRLHTAVCKHAPHFKASHTAYPC